MTYRAINFRRPAVATLILLICFLAAGCTKRTGSSVNSGSWTLENNQRAKLADYKGKVLVLDFYATWCEPCRVETPHLVQLQSKYADKGLQVVGLNVGGEDDRAQVPGFAKEFGIQYPLAFPDDDVVDQYLSDDQSIPQAFVFDRDGNLVKRLIGYSPQSGAELDDAVSAAITKPN